MKWPKVDRKEEGRKGDRLLALVPVTAFVFMAALLLPRTAPPGDVPVPMPDGRALASVEREDTERVASAKAARLPGDVLALGSAIRAFNALSTKPSSELEILKARHDLDDAMRAFTEPADASQRERAVSDVLTLRAVQLDAFLHEVEMFEKTGEISDDLRELGGTFVERMRDAGWVTDDHHVLLSPSQRRVAFKQVWNAVVGVDGAERFRPTLDEQRSLYALYLAHPHPPEFQREAFDAQRRAATTKAACERAEADVRRATELWRIDKIKRLGAIDPTYPTSYALGAAYFRAGRYDLSIEAYRSWLDAHPEGPYALRARNHLRAALAAFSSI